MGGYSAAGVLFLTPKTVRCRASCLPGTSEQRTPAFTHPRQGGCVGVPTEGGDRCAHPAIVPLLSFSPPNLLEALSA